MSQHRVIATATVTSVLPEASVLLEVQDLLQEVIAESGYASQVSGLTVTAHEIQQNFTDAPAATASEGDITVPGDTRPQERVTGLRRFFAGRR